MLMAKPEIEVGGLPTGEHVRALRKRLDWTQQQLADAADVNVETISRIENGGNTQTETLDAILNAMKSADSGASGSATTLYQRRTPRVNAPDDIEPEILDVSGHTTNDIPVIAEGEASPQGELFWDGEGKLRSDVEDRISRPYDVRDPRAYGVRVRGDSMLPAYKPGMTLVVSPNTPVGNGDEVYVQLLTGERLIKVARRMQGGWLLESINPVYEPRFVAQSEIGAMHPVMWSRRKR